MALGRDDGREPLKAGEYCTSKPVFFCSPEEGAPNQFVSREAYHAYKRDGRPCGSREMRACFFGNQYVDPAFIEDECEHTPSVGADCDQEPTPGRTERHEGKPKARKRKPTTSRRTTARVDPDATAIDQDRAAPPRRATQLKTEKRTPARASRAIPAGMDPDAAAIDGGKPAPKAKAATTPPKAKKRLPVDGLSGARCVSARKGAAEVSDELGKVKLPDGRTLTIRDMVVPVDSLVPSHGSIEGGRYILQDNANNGRGFPAEVQEDGSIQGANFTRDYARDTAFQQRLDDMFGADPGEPGAFDAELIASRTPSANLGAPVAGCVGDKLVVFGGNNRANILQRLMTARGKRGGAHRAEYAHQLDRNHTLDTSRIQRGVHVRVIDDDETPQEYGDIVKLMDDMNAGEAAAAPIRDKMKAATAAMTDDELDAFAHMLRQLPEQGALVTNLTDRTPITRGIAGFLLEKGLIPKRDARRFFADTRQEAFSEEGAAQVQQLLQALAISDDGAHDLLSSKVRMRAGIAKAVPTILAIGRKDPAFVSELQTAMREVRDREASEVKDDTYWNTVEMFTGQTKRDSIPPRVWSLFQFIEENKTAQNVWPKVLREYEESLDGAQKRRTFEEANTALPGFGPDPGAAEADPFADLFNVAGLRRRRRSPGRRRRTAA